MINEENHFSSGEDGLSHLSWGDKWVSNADKGVKITNLAHETG